MDGKATILPAEGRAHRRGDPGQSPGSRFAAGRRQLSGPLAVSSAPPGEPVWARTASLSHCHPAWSLTLLVFGVTLPRHSASSIAASQSLVLPTLHAELPRESVLPHPALVPSLCPQIPLPSCRAVPCRGGWARLRIPAFCTSEPRCVSVSPPRCSTLNPTAVIPARWLHPHFQPS